MTSTTGSITSPEREPTRTGATVGPVLAPHQAKAAKELKNGSILTGGVGSGKTRTALAYYYSLGYPYTKDIYVFTTAKKRDEQDWEAEAALWAISVKEDLSAGGVKIVVDSWNNITKYTHVKGAFVIFDEQRLVGNGPWVKAFYKLAAENHWLMLSATPGDTWMDYVPVFVAHGFYRNLTEFKRRHVVYNSFTRFPKIERYLETGELLYRRDSILVEMPYIRHTRRHIRNIVVEYDRALFKRAFLDRWHVYDERPILDISELFVVIRRIVNADPSRLGAVQKLYEKHPRLIVFYNFNYELDLLRTLCHTLEIPFAEWNGKKHEEIPDTEKWLYLVQYTAGAEGWNCISTDAICFYSLNYSWRLNEQAKGRIDRMNTPFVDLWYYYFISSSWIDLAIQKANLTKKNFNEKKALERS